jgi:hypothetical protein
MPFVLICRDKPGAAQLRQDTRAAHLAYLQASPAVKLAGPFLDDAGKPVGSLLMLDLPDRAAAEAWAAADPYALAGLFASVSVEPFRVVIG